MNGVGAALLRQSHNALRVEIAFEWMRFIGSAHVERVLVGFSEHRHRTNTHFTQCVADADSDFATVGDEYCADHFAGFLSFLSDFSIHGGLCRSRKACMPACPSAPARARAMASAANSVDLSNVRAATPNTSSFAAAIAHGADVRI